MLYTKTNQNKQASTGRSGDDHALADLGFGKPVGGMEDLS